MASGLLSLTSDGSRFPVQWLMASGLSSLVSDGYRGRVKTSFVAVVFGGTTE